MKAATTLALLAGSAAAAPALTTRQLGSTTRNDLEEGNEAECPGVILIFARATGEAGNMVGPHRYIHGTRYKVQS